MLTLHLGSRPPLLLLEALALHLLTLHLGLRPPLLPLEPLIALPLVPQLLASLGLRASACTMEFSVMGAGCHPLKALGTSAPSNRTMISAVLAKLAPSAPLEALTSRSGHLSRYSTIV